MADNNELVGPDDDGDDDVEEGGQQAAPAQNRARGNQGQGQRRNRQGPINLLSEENKGRAWSFVTNLVAMKANDVGQWAGGQGYGEKVLSAIESVFGRAGTDNFVFPALATIMNEPTILKTAIRAAGLPPQVNHVVEEALDDFIEGVRLKHRQTGQLTERDAQGASAAAQERLLARLSTSFTYPQSIGMLTMIEQSTLQGRISNLTEEQKEKFEKLRVRINHPRDLRVLLLMPNDQWIPHLEQKYGVATKPSTTQGIVNKIENAVTAADKYAKKILAPPATGPDTVVDNINKARASIKKRRFHV